MKYKVQDQRISMFYVTDRILEILEEEDNQIKMNKMLNEFKDELIHNLGVIVLHNHFAVKTRKDN